MLSIPGNARLFLCSHPMSMRKSFDGLTAEVEKLFPRELLTGAFFIFLNRRKDHMKVLFGIRMDLLSTLNGLRRGLFAGKRAGQFWIAEPFLCFWRALHLKDCNPAFLSKILWFLKHFLVKF